MRIGGGNMKSTVLLVFLVLATVSSTAAIPEDYSVNVHVTSSYWRMEPSLFPEAAPVQMLAVIIDGKKYELESSAPFKANLEAGVTLLALGDYKAKLVQDIHKTTYESSQAYEFLFTDKKTRKFFVVGQTE
jgi:hypothetical protein